MQHSHPEELPKSSPSPRRSSHSSPRRSSHSSNPPHNFNPPTPQYSVPIPPYSNSYRPSPAMNHPSPSPYHSRHAPSPYEQWRSQSMQTDFYNRRTPERTRSVQGSVTSLPVTCTTNIVSAFYAGTYHDQHKFKEMTVKLSWCSSKTCLQIKSFHKSFSSSILFVFWSYKSK